MVLGFVSISKNTKINPYKYPVKKSEDEVVIR
jgi:hypothetical protein